MTNECVKEIDKLGAEKLIRSNENQKLKTENKVLKEILLYSLSKYDLCQLCEVKGQKLSKCLCNSNKKCFENMLKLWSV